MFSTPLIALFDELLNIQKPHNSNGIVSFRWALPFIERTDNARGFNRMKFGNQPPRCLCASAPGTATHLRLFQYLRYHDSQNRELLRDFDPFYYSVSTQRTDTKLETSS